ncbi:MULTISPECIES: hypothetical protein [Bacillus cereus group]|uniref:Uncharacterized protein n=1 Tax=Bacillus thuringiensis subsp. jegathesan TaxID=56955 RepID=A0A9X6MIH6_BACTJ|nr:MULTISPECIES: hypothetical protein [Bacillus cereus group]MCQ6337870.1 hypothetical protein [Bacillus cereus]MCU5489793.1 hypothetical protein [Bacillus cereus]MEB8702229.1 hypothetical protein [Bacillus cereus]OUB78263.1 hypothetical protein BK750_00410 [Bacillus thuringiensis serovar jegathesan]PFO25030.1 hypothetical protein COJ78_31025 [Bacillus thuringiensis]
MDVTQMTQLIGSLGFPIFACIYHMTTMKKTLDANTQSINANTQIMMQVQAFIAQVAQGSGEKK